jgi:hypothetical protein
VAVAGLLFVPPKREKTNFWKLPRVLSSFFNCYLRLLFRNQRQPLCN